jgi:hypothetical protein
MFNFQSNERPPSLYGIISTGRERSAQVVKASSGLVPAMGLLLVGFQTWSRSINVGSFCFLVKRTYYDLCSEVVLTVFQNQARALSVLLANYESDDK